MADIAFAVASVALGVLVGANTIVVLARIAGQEKIAKQVIRKFSHVTWLFKLGSDGNGRRSRGTNGPLRV